MKWSEQPHRVRPEEDDADQEPVNVNVDVADVQGAGADADLPGDAGQTADDESSEGDFLDEAERPGERLLDLADVVAVRLVDPELGGEHAEESGRGLLKRVFLVRAVEEQRGTGADDHHCERDDQDGRVRGAVGHGDQRGDRAGEFREEPERAGRVEHGPHVGGLMIAPASRKMRSKPSSRAIEYAPGEAGMTMKRTPLATLRPLMILAASRRPLMRP